MPLVGPLRHAYTSTSAPDDLTNCILDCTADNPSGTPRMTDSVGTFHLTQSTAGYRPTYNASDSDFGGKPSLTFDGVDDYVGTSANVTTGVFTMVLVVKATAAGVLHYRSDGTNVSYCYNSTGGAYSSRRLSAAGESSFNLSSNWGVGTYTIIETFDGTDAGHTMHRNGTAQTKTPVATGNPGSTGITSPLYIMDLGAGGGFFVAGKLARVRLYNAAIGSTQRATVEAFMRATYSHY